MILTSRSYSNHKTILLFNIICSKSDSLKSLIWTKLLQIACFSLMNTTCGLWASFIHKKYK